MKDGVEMAIKIAAVLTFVALALSAWPSTWIREVSRRIALVTLSVAVCLTVGLGLALLTWPVEFAWLDAAAFEAWLADQLVEAQTVPRSVWWLLGAATIVVSMIHGLWRTTPSSIFAVGRSTSAAAYPRRTRVHPSANGSRPELLQALEAMHEAKASGTPSRRQRVENLLPPG